MSPSTGLATLVATRVTRLAASSVPVSVYLPSAVKVISGAVSLPPSVALPAAVAPLRKPWGVTQISSWRSSACAGWGTGPVGPTFHATSPATACVCWRPPKVSIANVSSSRDARLS